MPQVTDNQPRKKVLKALFFDLPNQHDPLNTASKPPMKLSYSFDSGAIAGLDLGYSGWAGFSDAQKQTIRAVLAEYETFLNVDFVETSAGGDLDLYFGRANIASDGLGGIRWRMGPGTFDLDGYAVFDTGQPLTGAYGYHLALHEIGHAMTLKHPGNYGGDEGPFLKKSEENNKHSAMSYRDNPDSGDLAGHLMLYDIAALQARFGANLGYRTGNDVYTKPDGRLQVIWDAGGTDSIDGSGYASALAIDLRDGRFSSLGQKDNIAIAYGAVIEAATGGSGDDRLTGNKRANILDGGGGSDIVNGGKGSDTLTGGPGADAFVFSIRAGRDTVTDFDPGVDAIRLDKQAFAGLGGRGPLDAGKFHVGAAAHDRGDRVIYDADAGVLIHDSNGNRLGKATVFAAIGPGLDLDSGSFLVA